jgi:hypothetical protein
MNCEAWGPSLERSQGVSWLSFYIHRRDRHYFSASFAGFAVNVSFKKEEKYESSSFRLKEAV